jgi:hypothetical protein
MAVNASEQKRRDGKCGEWEPGRHLGSGASDVLPWTLERRDARAFRGAETI